jgi:asparagine N-glycosylation enzyme membrane subunit Stt3
MSLIFCLYIDIIFVLIYFIFVSLNLCRALSTCSDFCFLVHFSKSVIFLLKLSFLQSIFLLMFCFITYLFSGNVIVVKNCLWSDILVIFDFVSMFSIIFYWLRKNILSIFDFVLLFFILVHLSCISGYHFVSFMKFYIISYSSF